MVTPSVKCLQLIFRTAMTLSILKSLCYHSYPLSFSNKIKQHVVAKLRKRGQV